LLRTMLNNLKCKRKRFNWVALVHYRPGVAALAVGKALRTKKQTKSS